MRVLLFSGGLDSTAIANWVRPDKLLFIDYGQIPAAGEKRAALQIASELRLEIDVRAVDARSFGTGELAGLLSIGNQSEFWPFRNQFLVTLAAMTYSSCDPLEILIGTVATDNVHPDGSVDFISALDNLIGTQGRFSVSAPAIGFDTTELIRVSGIDANILGWAFSCHTGADACGQCRGCLKHFDKIRGILATPPPSATPQ